MVEPAESMESSSIESRGSIRESRRLMVGLVVGVLLVAGIVGAAWATKGSGHEGGAGTAARSEPNVPVEPTVAPPVSSTTVSNPTTTTAHIDTFANPSDGPDDTPPVTGFSGTPGRPITALEDGSVFDPSWRASIELGCGSTPELRRVTSLTAETAGRGEALFYQAEPEGRLNPVEIGMEFPVGSEFAWSVQNILLGPWPVGEVVDACQG